MKYDLKRAIINVWAGDRIKVTQHRNIDDGNAELILYEQICTLKHSEDSNFKQKLFFRNSSDHFDLKVWFTETFFESLGILRLPNVSVNWIKMIFV